MEQAGGAAGDQAGGPGAHRGRAAIPVCSCGACASGLVSRALGRLRDPPWGYYGPCARCSLTARVHRRDTQARPGAEAKAERLLPRAAAERREARRWAIPPVISGDPEIGSTARRAIGCGASAPAPVGALLPSFSFGEPKRTRAPAPTRSGRRSFGLALSLPLPPAG